MTRDEILTLIRDHLADELGADPARIEEGTVLREDLNADSLDLYSLVQELEDQYGLKIPDEDALGIRTVGQAADYVLAHQPAPGPRT
jgi:acyl carrier protein